MKKIFKILTLSIALTLIFNLSAMDLFTLLSFGGTGNAGTTVYPWDLSHATYDSKSYTYVSGYGDWGINVIPTQNLIVNTPGGSSSYLNGYLWKYFSSDDISTIYGGGGSQQISFPDRIYRTIRCYNNGLRLYISDTYYDCIYDYILETAYDFTSMESLNYTLSDARTVDVQAISVSDDGLTLWFLDGSNTIYQYTMTTAGNLSTASYASKSFSVATQESAATSMVVSPDGTKLFVVGGNAAIYQYTISTAKDISTASYDSVSLDISSYTTSPTGLDVSDSGTRLYFIGSDNYTVYQFSM